MKKSISTYLSLVFFTSLSICACSNPIDEHIHTFSKEWSFDDTYHFHPADCGHDLISEQEEHVYGDWEIEKEPTLFDKGNKYHICEICGYKESVDIDRLVDENALDLPIFYINTENATPITSKEEYVNATLDITNADDYCDSGLTLGIRGRGNYSWSGTEKKSYRIKFDKKYQPLSQGKGKAKSWTLLAVHCDKTLLRTDAAFYFASKLENLPFVSSSSFVELYLNGQYDGVYELCDQIQVHENRVNIDDTSLEEENGYLIELDKNASEDVISTSSGVTYEVKSDYANEDQLTFITNYLNKFERAMRLGTKKTILELADMPSAVDAYLVEELFKNLDVGWGSFYYTKPKGDKLYFGPVWDFDLTSGNADSDNGDSKFTSYKYTYVGNQYFSSYMQQHYYYKLLRQYDWFNIMIQERWQEVKAYALETVEHIRNMSTAYHNSFERNFTRWPIFSVKINREPRAVLSLKSYDAQVDYLINWLTNRISWLDGYYAGNETDIGSTWNY